MLYEQVNILKQQKKWNTINKDWAIFLDVKSLEKATIPVGIDKWSSLDLCLYSNLVMSCDLQSVVCN